MESMTKKIWDTTSPEHDQVVKDWCFQEFDTTLERLHNSGNGATFVGCCMTFLKRNKRVFKDHEKDSMISYGTFKSNCNVKSSDSLFEALKSKAKERYCQGLPVFMPSIDAQHESKVELKQKVMLLQSKITDLTLDITKLQQQADESKIKTQMLEIDLNEAYGESIRHCEISNRHAKRLDEMADKWYMSVQASLQNKRVVGMIMEEVAMCSKCSKITRKLSALTRDAPSK